MVPIAALTPVAMWTALSMWAPGPRLISKSTEANLADVVGSRGGPGALWVGPLSGNGGRDVVVYRPPAWRPGDDTSLVVHFHGTYGERMHKKSDQLRKREYIGRVRLRQVLDAIDELQGGATSDANVALVYPISAGKRKPHGATGWWNYDFDSEWMDSDTTQESLAILVHEAKQVLEDHLGVPAARVRGMVLAEGHSAGGVALYNVAWNSGEPVHEYLFLDATFETWADGTHFAIHHDNADAKLTLVITEGGIADPLGGRTPWCIHAEEEGGRRWKSSRDWCVNLREGMRDVDDVYMHYTSVRHGDQPRTFAGGLGLPSSRFTP